MRQLHRSVGGAHAVQNSKGALCQKSPQGKMPQLPPSPLATQYTLTDLYFFHKEDWISDIIFYQQY